MCQRSMLFQNKLVVSESYPPAVANDYLISTAIRGRFIIIYYNGGWYDHAVAE